MSKHSPECLERRLRLIRILKVLVKQDLPMFIRLTRETLVKLSHDEMQHEQNVGTLKALADLDDSLSRMEKTIRTNPLMRLGEE